MNVLFTSVGRRVELIRAFHRAYQFLQMRGNVVALDIDPLAPVFQLANRSYIVPRLNSPDYISTLISICEQEQVNLIFPLIDPDVPILARHKEVIEATGARLAVVPVEAATITGDKWLTAEFFQSLELPTPRSWIPGYGDPSQSKYPLFIKPRDGSAGQFTFKIHNSSELAFFLDYVPNPIVQEYVDGPEITNDVICDFKGEVLSVVSRRRIEARSGEVAKGVTIYDRTITEACIKIAKALSAIGPITVQCLMKDGILYFTEVNARFGGGLPLGIAAGVDSPRWLLALAAGLPIEIPPVGTYKTGLYMTRFDDSFFLTEEDYARSSSRYL